MAIYGTAIAAEVYGIVFMRRVDGDDGQIILRLTLLCWRYTLARADG